MTLKAALRIVVELAEQNALDPATCEPDLCEEAYRQAEALKKVREEWPTTFYKPPM